MKRQVKVMLKEKKRLKRLFNDRFLQLNKPKTHFRIMIEYMFIINELNKWR